MRDIYKEFGVDVLRDSENAGPSAAEMKMAQEIKRLRARVEVLEAALHAIFPDGANIKLVPKASAEEAKP